MQRASIGFRLHSGWAVAVTVAGSIASPSVVDRRRMQLVKDFTYKFRQPYHTAAQMPRKEAAEFIKKVETEARDLARSEIDALQRRLARVGYGVVGCGLLLSSGRELPVLAQILASHALIHTADGELSETQSATHARTADFPFLQSSRSSEASKPRPRGEATSRPHRTGPSSSSHCAGYSAPVRESDLRRQALD